MRHTQTHHLELTVADAPLVLDRIVTLCRGRRCTIVALRFEAADRHRPGLVRVTIEAEPARAQLAMRRLSGVPGVLAVAADGSGESAEVRARSVTHRALAAPASA